VRGVPWSTVRQWRAARQHLLEPASTLRGALEALPPLAAGPSAYLSLWARVRPRPTAREVEALVAKREELVPHFVHGLGDVLVPPPLVAPFAAVRLYRVRRDARRSRRVRGEELALEKAAADLLPTLSERLTPLNEVGSQARDALDQLCSRGRVAKYPEAGALDGQWSYALSPAVEAEAESHAAGWSFLEDLGLHFLTVAGPATRDDFAWWSGASGAAARRTIEEMAGSVEEVDLEGGRQAHFMIEEDAARLRRFAAGPSDHAALLPSLDPVRFAGRAGFGALAGPRVAARVAPPARRRGGALTAGPRVALVGGSPVGTWDWPAGAAIDVHPIGLWDAARARAVEAEREGLEGWVEARLPWAAGVRAL